VPKIKVNGVSIAYEVAGKGPPIVWTPGGWFPRNAFTYVFAGRLSANYQVLTWDRRNSGASDIAIEDAESELHLWTDDLHALLQALDLSPAYVGGDSVGCVMSLLMAHRYPQDVKGLLLQHPPTDDVQACLQPLAKAHYLCLVRAAESRGMKAVIETSADPPEPEWAGITGWVTETIAQNPENRERLLSMDPGQFAAIMRKWAKWFASPRLHLSNLSEEELAGIDVPAIVSHDFGAWHPEHTARALYRLLPNAEWVDYSSRYTPEEIQEMADIVHARDIGTSTKLAFRFPFYEDFLRRVESGEFGETRQPENEFSG
jgi:pimeloyl-ACP methyl ester carboxylesterase